LAAYNLPNKNVVCLENPTLKDASELVKIGLTERKTLIIVGNCWVEYRGRASSKLKAGERIVMIKEDGSVLVHRPIGYEPVNWQPPGCIFQTHVSDKTLQIRAVRRKPQESIRLFFDHVYLISVASLTDAGEFALYASEEDMQKAILFDPTLIGPDFEPISYEKKVKPGFIDVYGTDKEGNFVVVEIKRKTATREAALQLAKYVESVRRIVNRQVRGILAAPHMGKDVQKLLATLELDFKPLDPKKCADILRKTETKKLADFFR
jgi:RecB family endonuclease NucS